MVYGPKVSAVIPTLNEAENLPHVFARIPDCVDEVIVVDGLSTDDTVGVVSSISPRARIVLQRGQGKGDALACGFAAATGDIIVALDADGSTDPAEIPNFVAPLLRGADFVKGSRYMRADGGGSADLSRVRSFGNRGLSLTVNLLFGTRFTDLCYGFNAFWRDCLPYLQVDCDGFEVETVLSVRAAKAGLTMMEVASFEHQRINGLSNLKAWRDGKRVLRTILRERMTGRLIPCDDWKPDFDEVVRGQLQILSKPPMVAKRSSSPGDLIEPAKRPSSPGDLTEPAPVPS